MGSLLDQAYELVAVDRLEPHPDNPRRGDLGVIGESVATNGFYGALVAQRSTGFVLAGNHRLLAARAAGLEEVPVVWVDVDDVGARRILLVDNRANDKAGYDSEALVRVLEDLARDGLQGTGWTEQDLAQLLAGAPEGRTDVDDIPAPPAVEPRSKRGQVWLLGPHRLVVGDATRLDDVRAALGGRPADLVWTDPPYGVSYVGGTKDRLKIANDDLSAADLGSLLDGAFGVLATELRPGGAFYICSAPGRLETTFRLALDGAGLELRQQIVWVKDRFVLGHSDYHLQHETILFGWQLDGEPEAPPLYESEHDTILYGWAAGAGHSWEGGRKQSTLWAHPRPVRNADHPTAKPVDLVRRAVTNSSKPGQLVLDPFAGSGSALIAAHHTGRLAALVELDPVYADVICRRWELHTGSVPVLEGVGEVSFTDG